MKTIKSKLLLFSVAQILIVVAVILTISYEYFYKTLEQNYKASVTQTISQIAENIDTYITDINNMSIAFHYTKDIKDFFYNNTGVFKDEKTVLDLAQVYVNALVDMKSGIEGIYLLRNDGTSTCRSSTNMYHSPYSGDPNSLKLFAELKGNSYLVKINRSNNNYRVITFARRFLDIQGNNECLGTIIIDIKTNTLEKILQKIDAKNSGQVFITDRDGYLIYHPDKSRIGQKCNSEIYNSIKYGTGTGSVITGSTSGRQMVNFVRSRTTGWTIITVMEGNMLMKNVVVMRNNIIIVSILLSIFSIFLVLVFSHRMTKPLAQLKKSMEKVKGGNFNEIKIDIDSNDEVGQLSEGFMNMVGNIRQLIDQVVIEQKQKRIAEFKALQSQINPHFLYNTLGSVIWMIFADKKSESIEMLTSLTSLLRISLSNGNEIISIGKELEHLGCYVTIQKMRYGSKLNVKFDIEEGLLDYTVPKLTLQPIVENSIYHGIKMKKCGGCIKVVVRSIQNLIVFKVIDNGIGMDDETLNNIMITETANSKSYGVSNVNEKIKLRYGYQYGIRFSSRYGKGTMAVISIPARKAGEAEYV